MFLAMLFGLLACHQFYLSLITVFFVCLDTKRFLISSLVELDLMLDWKVRFAGHFYVSYIQFYTFCYSHRNHLVVVNAWCVMQLQIANFFSCANSTSRRIKFERQATVEQLKPINWRLSSDKLNAMINRRRLYPNQMHIYRRLIYCLTYIWQTNGLFDIHHRLASLISSHRVIHRYWLTFA